MEIRDLVKGALIAGAAIGAGNSLLHSEFVDIEAELIGLYASSVAWGDFNGNGRLDLAVSGWTAYDGVKHTKIYRNNGDGTFTDIDAGLTGVSSGALAWGDFNGNGLLDLAVSGLSDSGRITKIYRNNGNGTFTDINAGLPGVIGSIVWGDFNNNGLLDLAISGATGTSSSERITRIYRNNGDETFTDINAGLTGLSSWSVVAWGDFNGNGLLDLAISGFYTEGATHNITKIYRNNGDGSFTGVESGLPQVRGSVAWGDFNNNGKLDLAVSYSSETKIYTNKGDGTFSDMGISLIGSTTAHNLLSVGDFNNNGYLDIIARNKIYRNNGDGTFTDIGVDLPAVHAGSVAWGDFNNNGKLDLAISGEYGGGRYIRIYRNDTIVEDDMNTPEAVMPTWGTTIATTPAEGVKIRWPFISGHSYEISMGSSYGLSDIMTRRVPQINGSYSFGAIPGGRQFQIFCPNQDGTYYYRVRTVDTKFVRSGWGSENSIRIIYKPTELVVSNVGPNVYVHWEDNSVVASKYSIYRSREKEGYEYQKIAELGGNAESYVDEVLENDRYYYRIGVYDTVSGQEFFTDGVLLDLQFERPEIKEAVVRQVPAEVEFSWNEITDCNGYIIQRSSDGNVWQTLATNETTSETNYSDTPSVAKWYYRVGAIYGEYVAYGSVLIADLNNPTQDIDEIRNLKLTAYSDRMFLQWEDYSIREDGFRVRRSEDGASFSNIVVLPENTLSYLDEELESHKWYWYKVEMVEMGSIATNISGENETNIVTNYNVLSTSSLESNFTGNVKMQVTSLRFNGNRDDIGVEFEVFDADGDNLKGVRLYYRVGNSDWISGTIEGDDSFLPKTSYSIVWKSKEDLLYNGKVTVRLEVFDGFEWSYSGEYELIIRNGASGDIEYATIPDIAGSGDIFRVTDMVSGSVVSLYDIRGKLVRHLEVGDDGVFSWNMTNEGGMRVPVGYYVMIIEADGKRRRKVIFVVQ